MRVKYEGDKAIQIFCVGISPLQYPKSLNIAPCTIQWDIVVCSCYMELFAPTAASQVALVVKNPAANAGNIRDLGFESLDWTISLRKKWLPTPVFWPGESHGQRGLVSYDPWCRKESDMTEATQHAQCTSTTGSTNSGTIYYCLHQILFMILIFIELKFRWN